MVHNYKYLGITNDIQFTFTHHLETKCSVDSRFNMIKAITNVGSQHEDFHDSVQVLDTFSYLIRYSRPPTGLHPYHTVLRKNTKNFTTLHFGPSQ